MTAAIALLEAYLDYPEPYTRHYGVPVWCLGEDGDDGWMAAGHDRRSYAALSAEIRDSNPGWRRCRSPRERAIERKWVRFHHRCGHTEAEHDTHLADDRDCDCRWYGLPPCDSDRFAWQSETVPAGTEGALPVLRVDV